MDKIRIIHILPNAHIGGISKYVYELAEEQKKNSQLEIAILFYNSQGGMLELFIGLQIPIFQYQMGAFDFSICRNKILVNKMNEFDIIHWHVFIPTLSILPLCKRVKQIFTHHSVLGSGRLLKRTDFIKWNLFKWFINNKINGVIFNSEYTREFWYSRGVFGRKVTLIYNGVNLINKDIPPIDEGTRKFISQQFVIGTMSNFIGWKRIELLIKAFAMFQQNKKNVCLLLVGDGVMKNLYMDLIKQLDIEELVYMPGHRLNILAYQKTMDVCVFPSMTETFGLVAIECMNLGKPVVVFEDGGGIVEVVGKGSPNIISNIELLVDRMEYYYKNPDLLKQESLIYQKQSSLFSIQKNENKVMAFYRQIISNWA